MTKELKKKHSSRPVGGAETGRRVGVGGWRGLKASLWLEDQAVPRSHADKPGGTTGEQESWYNPVFQCRAIKPQNLWL